MSNPAIFLDRDGVICDDDGESVVTSETFEFLPNAVEAMKLLATLPYKIIITTNQPWISKKKLTIEELNNTHDKMKQGLKQAGARIDAIYYCPHQESDNCDCRKPKPKMHLDAAKKFDIDLKQSVYVGDSTKDIKLANDLGETAILLKTGRAGKDGKFEMKPDYVEKDILSAAKVILKIFSTRNS